MWINAIKPACMPSGCGRLHDLMPQHDLPDYCDPANLLKHLPAGPVQHRPVGHYIDRTEQGQAACCCGRAQQDGRRYKA